MHSLLQGSISYFAFVLSVASIILWSGCAPSKDSEDYQEQYASSGTSLDGQSPDLPDPEWPDELPPEEDPNPNPVPPQPIPPSMVKTIKAVPLNPIDPNNTPKDKKINLPVCERQALPCSVNYYSAYSNDPNGVYESLKCRIDYYSPHANLIKKSVVFYTSCSDCFVGSYMFAKNPIGDAPVASVTEKSCSPLAIKQEGKTILGDHNFIVKTLSGSSCKAADFKFSIAENHCN